MVALDGWLAAVTFLLAVIGAIDVVLVALYVAYKVIYALYVFGYGQIRKIDLKKTYGKWAGEFTFKLRSQ